MSTTIRLTAQSEKLLKEQLAARPDASPEEIIERALETFARQNVEASGAETERKMTPAEAVARMAELRKNQSLDGIKIKDLINEGRKY
jgi:predicted transcriptional regulator